MASDSHRLVRTIAIVVVIAGAAGSIAWVWQQPVPASPRGRPGWALYDRLCLPCHGAAGDGLGPAAPYTARRPRDFTKGEFAWRTTKLGDPPTDDDLRLTIRYGAPGTSMPAFALDAAQIDQLVDVVKSFAPQTFARTATVVTLAAPPAPDAARGARMWKDKGCASCHGATGSADSMFAKSSAQPPYDLTRRPLARPHVDAGSAESSAPDKRRAAALAIATGRSAMPAYAGTMRDEDIWALADHVLVINARGISPTNAGVLDARTIDLDRTAKVVTGTWPAKGEEAVVFGTLLAPQGPPPATLAPAQASLSAPQCARCHIKQYREWETSLHRRANSPGFLAQMMGMQPAEAASCLRCHTPLAEQATDERLATQGLSCAGCHVRDWKRHGPPNVAPSLLSLPTYPLATLEIYERADFCLPCHQLPSRTAVAGRPLLDTYREWLEGPYMPRGIQCQHCHMPNREHSFLGIHDQHTFQQSYALTARAHVKNGAVTVVAELANVGAGHYLPTTPTPAAWLVIELVDVRGKLIEGAKSDHRIGRDIYFEGSWHERADTRIPPGEKATMARAWSGGRTRAATHARVSLIVSPDDYYERLYAERLAGKLVPARRALYEQALAKAKAAHYTATQRFIPIVR